MFINVWTIGSGPNHCESPLEFKSERFIGEDRNGHNHLDVRGQHYELIPFGSGRRMCPKTSLALQVVNVNLAAMIQYFEWKLDGGDRILDMEEKLEITIPRAHPVIYVPIPRLNPFPSI